MPISSGRDVLYNRPLYYCLLQQSADELYGCAQKCVSTMMLLNLKVPHKCPLHTVQRMETSPLRHLPSLMMMETIARLSWLVLQCVSTTVCSTGPQSYSYTEVLFSHTNDWPDVLGETGTIICGGILLHVTDCKESVGYQAVVFPDQTLSHHLL